MLVTGFGCNRHWQATWAGIVIVVAVQLSDTLPAVAQTGAAPALQTAAAPRSGTHVLKSKRETVAGPAKPRRSAAMSRRRSKPSIEAKTLTPPVENLQAAAKTPEPALKEGPASLQERVTSRDQPEGQPQPTQKELAAIASAFCANNAASAAEARLAAQRKELDELSREVEKKSIEVVERAKEARKWVERREKLIASAREALVETYAKMKPEAAAQQIGSMSEEAALSILTKLNARASSAILNEMGPDRAARLADAALKKASSRAPEKSGS